MSMYRPWLEGKNRGREKRLREDNVEDSASRNPKVEQAQSMMRAMDESLLVLNFSA